MDNIITIHENNLPDCCKNCSNRPKQGEMKVCNCVLTSLTRTKLNNKE